MKHTRFRFILVAAAAYAPCAAAGPSQDSQPYRLERPVLSLYEEAEPITIDGDGDHRIERLRFAPVAGEFAIRINNHAEGQIVIRDCVFLGAHGMAEDGLDPRNGGGILAWQSSNIRIENCYFEAIQEFCVRIMGSTEHPSRQIVVTGNDMSCLQADYTENTPWGYTADGVQFIQVEGPGNAITGNRCVNRPGVSYLTDFINIYCSSGTPDSPLRVDNNLLIGAGAEGLYNQYGCGIQINDHPADRDAGAHVWATGNVLIDPGIVGMNIDGGFDARMIDNWVLMSPSHRTTLADGPVKRHPTWAAITLFNYSGGITRDSNHEVRGNRVAFRAGPATPFINSTKPADTVVRDNIWQAEVSWDELVRERLSASRR